MKPRLFSAPRSRSAIKAIASKKRKADPSLSQALALDQSAREAGYSNWKHASKTLPETMRLVRFSAEWASGRDQTAGIETISYPLPWSAAELIGQVADPLGSSLEAGGFVEGFMLKDAAANQITTRPFPYQALARKVLVRTLRTLMFREATGLVQTPNRYFDSLTSNWTEEFQPENFDFPGSKYFTSWRDPATQALVILNEPITAPGDVGRQLLARQAWCDKHRYQMVDVPWSTIVGPSMSMLLGRCDDGCDLGSIASKLAGFPQDFSYPIWIGESEPASFSEMRNAFRTIMD